jgi:lipoate-protein ligase B
VRRSIARIAAARRLAIGPSAYVAALEDVMIETLARFGIVAGRSDSNRGAWVADAKIGAVGVRISRGITTHGFALNVNTDLAWFDYIIPCGISGAKVTSMQALASETFDMRAVEDELAAVFAERFALQIVAEAASAAAEAVPA